MLAMLAMLATCDIGDGGDGGRRREIAREVGRDDPGAVQPVAERGVEVAHHRHPLQPAVAAVVVGLEVRAGVHRPPVVDHEKAPRLDRHLPLYVVDQFPHDLQSAPGGRGLPHHQVEVVAQERVLAVAVEHRHQRPRPPALPGVAERVVHPAPEEVGEEGVPVGGIEQVDEAPHARKDRPRLAGRVLAQAVEQHVVGHERVEGDLGMKVEEDGRALRRQLVGVARGGKDVLEEAPLFLLEVSHRLAEGRGHRAEPELARVGRLPSPVPRARRGRRDHRVRRKTAEEKRPVDVALLGELDERPPDPLRQLVEGELRLEVESLEVGRGHRHSGEEPRHRLPLAAGEVDHRARRRPGLRGETVGNQVVSGLSRAKDVGCRGGVLAREPGEETDEESAVVVVGEEGLGKEIGIAHRNHPAAAHLRRREHHLPLAASDHPLGHSSEELQGAARAIGNLSYPRSGGVRRDLGGLEDRQPERAAHPVGGDRRHVVSETDSERR